MQKLALVGELSFFNSLADAVFGSFEAVQIENNDIADINNEYNAVVVCADCCCDGLEDTVNTLKGKNLPVILITETNDMAQQSRLCGVGADDVIVLPLCRELLLKRICDAVNRSKGVKSESDGFCMKFDELLDSVNEKDNKRGAFCVGKDDFANIYRFILRGLERSEGKVQMVLFTLECDGNEPCDEVMSVLAGLIQLCLRRGDISSVFSKNQVVIMLLGTDDNGAHLVANRILSSFYGECDDGTYELNYDIREINFKK